MKKILLDLIQLFQIIKKHKKAINLLLTFVILFYLYTYHFEPLSTISLQNIQIQFLFYSIFFFYTKFLLSIYRFHILLKSQNIVLTTKELLLSSMQGQILDSITQSSLGLLATRIYAIKQRYPHKNFNYFLSLVLIDKAFAFAGIFLLSSLSLIYISLFTTPKAYTLHNNLLFIICSLAGSLTFIISIYISNTKTITIAINRKIKSTIILNYLSQLIKYSFIVIRRIYNNGKSFYSILFYSITTQVMSLLSLLCILYTYSINIDFTLALFILPIAFISNLLGLLGGIGIGTLGIGYVLENILLIENAYFYVFLWQSFNILVKIPYLFALLFIKK